MPISYADAFSLIWEKPAPIIYLDTCILLDIVRSPIRDNIDSNSAKLAKLLTTRSNPNQRTLWLVTSATVKKEWQENIVEVLEETKREIIKLELRRRHFFAAVKSVTYIGYQDGQLERSDILHLLADLRSIADSLLNSCLVIVSEDEHLVRQ